MSLRRSGVDRRRFLSLGGAAPGRARAVPRLGGHPKPASMSSWSYWPDSTRPPRFHALAFINMEPLAVTEEPAPNVQQRTPQKSAAVAFLLAIGLASSSCVVAFARCALHDYRTLLSHITPK